MYLAHTLKLAADRTYGHSRSPASTPNVRFEAPVVVGVVGMVHVPGIVQNWETVQPEDVAKVNIPSMTAAERVTRHVIGVSFTSFALYAGYRLFRNPLSRFASVISRRKK